MQAEAGRTYKGKVTGITKFGAFVRLEDGSNGLIHISQVSDVYVSNVEEFLSVGQEVEPRILSIDDKGRISLTLKPICKPSYDPIPFKRQPQPTSFEEMMEQFRSVSEEKLCELRRIRSRKK